ncbi:HAMP domain-containing protein [Clostridium tyrobutyricum]|uniref:histidine kinase n=1 Tax=Clostridium tyrobutyricum DIVETGP TaxID=1408889 RepID=W6N2Q4_CLOTY|nr:HAMP domain-containing sensor histidine kinase [Clostridium tyrobutyricum]AND85116.1 phosphate regulon sensor histidine kinase [Clostridium tyrobutyricum]ANP69674.1 PAS domain-containing sensor histidine kinase [Clostridium tyrobutyricum]MBV4432968.1 cell wall metabolism sensor histidine kinase WalK [Clostridium tyrobutyricum]MBV4448763.1 cell wall metabolism sensor histidine kinase WalK [Clostridium tyrobutyricum]QNB65964.1 HAMP domain-containing protein [Clostridium tyrobutyricum]
MKKKLMIYMLGTLVTSLIIMTILFIIIQNHEYVENMKRTLKINNQIIINTLEMKDDKDKSEFLKNNFKNGIIRDTYINRNGKVISDSVAHEQYMENHNSRKEIEEARKNGIGYDIRISVTTKKNTLYFATRMKDGYIVRSSMTMQVVKGFENAYLKYYIIIMMLSIGISILLLNKFSKSIVGPVKKLQKITFDMANGQLDRRVNIRSKDEIGKLANTFNNMADKLELILNDFASQNNQLEAILKSMDSGVIAVDTNNKIIMINPYAKDMFRINRDIIGENLMDSIRDFELEDIFKYDDTDYREIKILWPKERNLRVKTANIINGDHNRIGTVAVVQDITDIKKLENMRSQFVANVSHELKTPLTSIRGFSETLRYVKDDKNKNKFLNIIDDEANRLTRLIDDILTLSNIENNKEVVKDRIDINSVIRDVCYLMSSSAKKKDIHIETNISEVPDIYGDKDRFKQMIINLIDNAIKYSDNGGRVKIGTKFDANKSIIWVEDNGVGISEEHKQRLFERFYRVDKARSRSQGGTGLGLAIVKHIVISFNGKIKVESKIGVGSKFIVQIPVN